MPHIVQTVEEMHTALGLVAAGIGVALIPSSMKKTHREGVEIRNLVNPSPVLELMMGYRKDETSPVVSRFIETVYSLNFQLEF